ncbi:MAG: nitrile hydratase subunit alpha [Candidatus Binataceae bacterium]
MAANHQDRAHKHEHKHDEHQAELAQRVKALESLLVSKGLIDTDALDLIVDTYENRLGPRNGAKMVARAWMDPAFKKRLMESGTAAMAEVGFPPGVEGANLVVIENTPKVHNMVVCTLCSCYPWPVLGLPPVWYKSVAYRSRAVSDPRGVLAEFKADIPEDVEIRVWDSSAEVRYLVLPMRPEGTDKMSEEELAELVTRDSMIGVGLPRPVKSSARARAANGAAEHRAS